MTYKIGLNPNLSRRDYLSIDAINISNLLPGRKTMAHLKWALENPREDTDDLNIGIALHVATLEPAEFNARVVVWEGRRFGKKWDEFEEENRFKLILRKTDAVDQMALVVRMRDALNKFPPMRKLLDAKGFGEVAVVWRDDETGLLCKGLIDRLCEWNGYTAMIDLKTCQDASKAEFSRTIGDHGYHIRTAWYLDALARFKKPEHLRAFYVAVEKKEPHLCNWFDADGDEETLKEGRKVYRRILNQYAESMKTNKWDGYPVSDSPDTIALNKWDFEK